MATKKKTTKRKTTKKKLTPKAAPKKTVAEKYAEMPLEDIQSIGASPVEVKKLMDIVGKMRSGIYTRKKTFERKGIYSFALDKLDKLNVDPRTPAQIYEDMTRGVPLGERWNVLPAIRNMLIHQFAKYQQVINAETFTVEGASRLNQEVSRRIFDYRGDEVTQPTLSQEDLTYYWEVFDEFASRVADISPYRTTPGRSAENQQLLAQVMYGPQETFGAYQDIIAQREWLKRNFQEYPEYWDYVPTSPGEKPSKMYYALKAKYLLEQLEQNKVKRSSEVFNDESIPTSTVSRGRRSGRKK